LKEHYLIVPTILVINEKDKLTIKAKFNQTNKISLKWNVFKKYK
jgi:hypothetical protein